MGKRGPKTQPPEAKRARGETRPSRTVVALYPSHADRPDPIDIPAPRGMTPKGRKVWKEKIDLYRARGFPKVSGMEHSLREFCELTARLREDWKTRDGPPMALVNAHRMWAQHFQETPDSIYVKPGGEDSNSRFGNNVKKR